MPSITTTSDLTKTWPASTSPRRFLAPAPCLVAACAACWPAFAHAFDVWSTTEEFSFGFLVPPVSVFLVWLHRAKLRRSIGADAGLIVVAVAVVVYILAHRVEINAIAGPAVVPLLLGSVVYLWGWRGARQAGSDAAGRNVGGGLIRDPGMAGCPLVFRPRRPTLGGPPRRW